MAVQAYITYQLLYVERTGVQPHRQAKRSGMELKGGQFHKNGKYLGYLVGDAADADRTIAALKAWLADELTTAEALAWADDVQPVNTITSDPSGETVYIGEAEFDDDGYIVKPTQATPWT